MRDDLSKMLALAAAALLLSPAWVLGADVGDVRGIVHDAEHRPIAAAALKLKSAHAERSRTAISNRDGEFSFPSVALGD